MAQEENAQQSHLPSRGDFSSAFLSSSASMTSSGKGRAGRVSSASSQPCSDQQVPVLTPPPQCHPPAPDRLWNSCPRDVSQPSHTGERFQTNHFPVRSIPPHNHPLQVLHQLSSPGHLCRPRSFLQSRQDHKCPQAPRRSLMAIHTGDSLGKMLHIHHCSLVSKKIRIQPWGAWVAQGESSRAGGSLSPQSHHSKSNPQSHSFSHFWPYTMARNKSVVQHLTR